MIHYSTVTLHYNCITITLQLHYNYIHYNYISITLHYSTLHYITYLPTYLHTCMHTYLHMYKCVYIYVYVFIYLSQYPPVFCETFPFPALAEAWLCSQRHELLESGLYGSPAAALEDGLHFSRNPWILDIL